MGDLGFGSGTYGLTFMPGGSQLTLVVESFDDLMVEADESFVVELLSATGAALGDVAARTTTGTIATTTCRRRRRSSSTPRASASCRKAPAWTGEWCSS